jgi:hypothetical protein
MDYRKLRDLLKAEKWKEANEETKRVMLAVAKREKEGWLNEGNIDNFPCEDLRTIDQLWVKYSDGKFGFSVQKRIYQSFGGTREYNSDIWEKFGDKVGWRKGGNWLYYKDKNERWLYYKDITFDKKAPEGHLPMLFKCRRELWEMNILYLWVWGLYGGGIGFFSRVETCRL